jgi:hypothetical protein
MLGRVTASQIAAASPASVSAPFCWWPTDMLCQGVCMPLASPQLLRFWTEMLPERERFSAFREESARQVLMDVADLSERNPHFDLTYLNLGQIAVDSLVGTASEFVRNTHHVKDGFGAFSVGVVAAGPVLARHAGQEHCLSVGSGLFFDHSRPHSTVRPNGGKVRNIFFPWPS